MKMESETRIPAPRAVVWEALNDETLLIECIPGCEALERISDTELAAVMSAKVGPVKATFKGEVRLENIAPPHSYTLVGQGKGAAGFAKGRADVALHDQADGGTLLAWSVEANIGGKLAQVGSRLIESTARKYADDFFRVFSTLVAERAAKSEEAAPQAEPERAAAIPPIEAEPRPGLSPWLWGAALAAAVGALLVYLASQ